MSTEKMNCSKCGTTMNHHADKPDRSVPISQPEADPEIANVLAVYACPSCGNTEVKITT